MDELMHEDEQVRKPLKCVPGQLIDTDMPMCMNDTENLTAVQTAMLRVVANGEYRFNSIPVVRKYELGSA
ncbi:hypothetical protein NXX65_00200 [Bacteroides fragilis]|nr:hypothetical protein [Bacteroides fragilis]